MPLLPLVKINTVFKGLKTRIFTVNKIVIQLKLIAVTLISATVQLF